jgi:hypothetical protein
LIPPRGPLPTLDAGAFSARLAIVVPYRDRAEHLSRLVPHLVTFFERDALARAIPYEVHIAEQAPGRPFNRGAIKNAGFAIAQANADYVVFHDVDYLPIWADYSCVQGPTSLITWGVQEEEGEGPSQTPGCVVALPVDDFVRVNGYSNDYWAWGFEDVDLLERIRLAGLGWSRRPGTFMPMPHAHHGADGKGGANEGTRHTRAIFHAKGAQGRAGFGGEGLSTLKFRVERTTRYLRNGVPLPQVQQHLIVLE